MEFDTTAGWHELHRLLKVSFPVDVTATEAVNEMQFGYVKRPTHRSRAYDKDRFEGLQPPLHRPLRRGHGAAVLNDCKYGVSMLENAINLTLLRAAASPEMAADNGTHHFTYAFTAWEGSLLESPVVREGYELNVSPVIATGAPGRRSFFSLEGGGNVVIDTVKPAEDQSGDIVLRLYESKHADTSCTLRWDLPVESAYLCNMLEEAASEEPLAVEGSGAALHFRPFEVKTVRLHPKKNKASQISYSRNGGGLSGPPSSVRGSPACRGGKPCYTVFWFSEGSSQRKIPRFRSAKGHGSGRNGFESCRAAERGGEWIAVRCFPTPGIKRRGRRATQHGKESCRLDQQASPHGEGVMAHGHTFYPDIKEG